jgi:broad specificity phosphatase PhoE
MQQGLSAIGLGKFGRQIVIVGHAGILLATIRDICHNVTIDELATLPIMNCSITEMEIEISQGLPRGLLKAWACNSHLYKHYSRT